MSVLSAEPPRLPAYRLNERYELVSLQQPGNAVPAAARQSGDAAPAWNAGLRSEKLGNGCEINLIDCLPAKDADGIVEGPPTFSISLFLEGEGSFSVENGRLQELRDGSLFLFHAPQPAWGRNQIRGGRRLRGVDFRFAPQSLEAVGLALPGDLGHGDSGSGAGATLLGRPLSDSLVRIAHETMGCPMRGVARRAFLQSKALEVLAHVIASSAPESRQPPYLKGRDRRLIEEAAEIVRQRYSEPWTIRLLARTVGLNERKLKEGFRQVLGRTVHGHLEATRVDAAKAFLTQHDLTATDTALAVGYSNPSHFAKIFRRNTGLSPNRWRRCQ